MTEHTFSETMNGEVIEATYRVVNTKQGDEVTVSYGGHKEVVYAGLQSIEWARRQGLMVCLRKLSR